MTPLQAARAHCPNYQADGSCLGIYYNDHLSIDRSRYRPCEQCLLGAGKRCEYFEEIIAAMRPARPKEAKALAKAVSGYQRQHKLHSFARSCPKCGERPLLRRQRMCAECRAERRRETHRKYNSGRKSQIELKDTTVNGFAS